ncbi:MAG: lipid IV(A) 3-deoxy-D-manno-octulosonic acid transferase [Arenicellales bacterium]|nr:lipid IV(A) 3-deoxy-D-manno-octulosonic acid transferase [Arenicellales bacterium]
MARLLYTLLLWIVLPVLLLRLLIRGFRNPSYWARWNERFGKCQLYPAGFTAWVHAVSVGEVNAATPLINQILQLKPNCRILVTTMTPTGSDQVAATFSNRVTHCYAPYDYPFAVRGFLEKNSPRNLILMETEIWPNMIHYCHQLGTNIIMTNVRLSEKSRRGYAKVLPVIGPALRKVDLFAAQSKDDQERLLALGVDSTRISRTGSMKFEIGLPASVREVAEAVRRDWGRDRTVVIAGSTHEGEESLLLELLTQISDDCPGLLLVLAPRHPERFESVAKLAVREGFESLRRSHHTGQVSSTVSVQIADTMGELPMLYAAADIAIVGGSLIRIKGIGGHNILEPCAVGVPVIFGQYMRNFSEISRLTVERRAGFQVDSLDELRTALTTLINDPSLRATMGDNGITMVSENAGATNRTLELLFPLLDDPAKQFTQEQEDSLTTSPLE